MKYARQWYWQKKDKKGNACLVGYVVANEAFDNRALRAYLISKLPDYMVPAFWVTLTHLPLTPNGKIDKKSAARAGFQ